MSVRLSVPSIDSSRGVQLVCCGRGAAYQVNRVGQKNGATVS